jgi:hypothetical protein
MYENRRGAYRVLRGKLRKRDRLEDLGIEGRIILNWIFKKYNEDVGWFDPAQDRDLGRSLVNALINLPVP